MSRPLPTAPRKHWADIVLVSETKADRDLIKMMRAEIQRATDVLARTPLADYRRPKIERKS